MMGRIISIVFICLFHAVAGLARDTDTLPDEGAVASADSVVTEVMETSETEAARVIASADTLPKAAGQREVEIFKPDPTKAVLLSLVPGLGQIYNRKYWKLPIVYGGFMGCIYAITWNNRNYRDYSTAYNDIMNENVNDPSSWHSSWQDLVPSGGDPADYINNENFKTLIKNRKDYYRRFRDLSIIITVGVYALCMIDAYVDAQLFDFDISPDLSLHWSPEVTPETRYTPASYGLNCSLKF